MSQEDLTIETESLVVRHVHTTEFAQLPSGEAGFELKSTLEVREKSSGALVTEQRVMPMTALIHIGHGYAVALSDLKALAPEYNFMLLDPAGGILMTALVTGKSGHCKSISETVTNFRRWFNRNDPRAVGVFQDDILQEVLVENPYGPEPPTWCRFKVGQ